MYDVIYVGWNDGTSLYHYGIKGQKWGERRYQNPDGTLTAEGRARYLKGQTFGSRGYESRATRNALKSGGKNSSEYKANKEYDKKINDYYNSASLGKNVLKDYLLGTSGAMTYNMARAAGEGRGKAFVRSVFDINVGRFAGGLASVAVTKLLGGEDKTALNFDYDADNKHLGIKEYYKKGSTLGKVAGAAAGVGTQVAFRNSGSELSLQQRALRKRATKRR